MTLQKLCGEIYKTASSCINFFRDIEVDQGSKASIQSGLALGVIVLSALILFPGKFRFFISLHFLKSLMLRVYIDGLAPNCI